MRVTKRQLKRIIREEAARLQEDYIDTELDHLEKNREDDLEHTIGEEVYNAAIANPKRFAKFSFSGARTAAGNPVIDHSYDVIAKSMEEMGMTKKEDFIFFGRMIGSERYKILAQKGMLIDPRPQGGATQQKKQPYPEGH